MSLLMQSEYESEKSTVLLVATSITTSSVHAGRIGLGRGPVLEDPMSA